MRSTVRTVGTTPVDVLDGISPGNEVAVLIAPRADVCVVPTSASSYDADSFGTVGPTGDVGSLYVTTETQSLWLVAASAGQKVSVFWSVG